MSSSFFPGSLRFLGTYASLQIKTWNDSPNHLLPYYAEAKDTRGHGEENYCRFTNPDTSLYLSFLKFLSVKM
jgi:hypothetical protein